MQRKILPGWNSFNVFEAASRLERYNFFPDSIDEKIDGDDDDAGDDGDDGGGGDADDIDF